MSVLLKVENNIATTNVYPGPFTAVHSLYYTSQLSYAISGYGFSHHRYADDTQFTSPYLLRMLSNLWWNYRGVS